MQGWIKLHRKLKDSHIFQNEKLLKVFIWCLLKANHAKREKQIGRQTIELEPGQFIFGRKKAALELDMKSSTAWDYMKVLESNNVIDIKSNNKFSLVSLVNWAVYQVTDENSDSKHDSKYNNRPTTGRQQTDTDKNDKECIKNDKKIIYADFVSMTETEYQKLVGEHGEPATKKMIEVLDNYKGSKGKKYKSDYRAILNWVVDRVKNDHPQLFNKPKKDYNPADEFFAKLEQFEREAGT